MSASRSPLTKNARRRSGRSRRQNDILLALPPLLGKVSKGEDSLQAGHRRRRKNANFRRIPTPTGRASGRIPFKRVIAARRAPVLPHDSGRPRGLALETLLALTSLAGCMNFKRVRAVRSNAARPGTQRMPGPASLQELTMASISDYAAAISHLL